MGRYDSMDHGDGWWLVLRCFTPRAQRKAQADSGENGQSGNYGENEFTEITDSAVIMYYCTTASMIPLPPNLKDLKGRKVVLQACNFVRELDS